MAKTSPDKPSRDWGIIKKREKGGAEIWYARIIRIDASGKKRQFTAKAENKTHARNLRDELQRKFGDRGEKAIEGDRLRFKELAEIYRERKLVEAQYHGSGSGRRKVGGVRSLDSSRHYLRVLEANFGNRLIRSISHADVEDFKSKRLKEPTIRGERSITDVNRTLELLRAVLRFGARNGWLARTPFEMGEPLISKADEPRRERVLSFQEEGEKGRNDGAGF
jgi:hypothetical protein